MNTLSHQTFLTKATLVRWSKCLSLKGLQTTTMVRETQFLTYDLDLEYSEYKERCVVNNIGRALVAKKKLSLASTELEVIKNCNIFDKTKTSP